MPPERRSPWSGLTASEALELADALTAPRPADIPPDPGTWTVYLEYARRAAAALVSNDLHGALRAAEIAAVALRLSQVPAYVPRERQPVIDKDPAAHGRPEAPAPPWPAHLGQANKHAELVTVTR